ncbi:MAG: hypothetical protein V7L31_19255 [Nostoc sp.]|uniref:hypothetical protein n=1 Tax=Nostoc sp. TaxID=1180 RepID=UPI002FF43C63
MQASLEQLSQIIVFAGLETAEKIGLQPYTQVQSYRKREIILPEGDRFPAKLYAVISGSIQGFKSPSEMSLILLAQRKANSWRGSANGRATLRDAARSLLPRRGTLRASLLSRGDA